MIANRSIFTEVTDYCQSISYPKIIIDATGSLIKIFKTFGMNKTKTIYLYKALMYDESKLHSFTVSNMISEWHTTLAIYNWLANWLNFNVPLPRETICDQSMALLSLCVKCFTQYSSLKQYIRVCAKLELDYEEWYNQVLSTADSEKDIHDLIEESWAEEIFEKSKEYIQEGKALMLSSSTGVESSFKILKVVTFIDLPTNIDLFLERLILSLREHSLLRSLNYTPTIIESDNFKEVIPVNQTNELHEDNFIAISEYNINDIIMDTKNEIPINKSITVNYLNNSRSITSLLNLKNGSKVTDLKSRNLKGYGKVALSNTCAFYALASILMVSYCTYKRYSKEIDCMENPNKFLSFVSSIVKKGINSTTYKKRVHILLNYLEPETTKIDYEITLVSCHATASERSQ
ncbi:Uncharacterized protein FWK35_00012605 [Aphis craccivora]|uniref:Uncharacterized protein n=1 Tax=Aphis craccivora TaxID=307492 RepID=A0A6G0YD02_APHCR|nr:Uncharacterized protein FWK35_00012605 [Aphis craccivora]